MGGWTEWWGGTLYKRDVDVTHSGKWSANGTYIHDRRELIISPANTKLATSAQSKRGMVISCLADFLCQPSGERNLLIVRKECDPGFPLQIPYIQYESSEARLNPWKIKEGTKERRSESGKVKPGVKVPRRH